MPAVLTEHGAIPFDESTAAPYSQAAAGNASDPDEQRDDYVALLRAADGRHAAPLANGRLDAIFFWQWSMPGAEGSLWLLDPEGDPVTHGAEAAQALVDFVGTATVAAPLPRFVLAVVALALIIAVAFSALPKRLAPETVLDRACNDDVATDTPA